MKTARSKLNVTFIFFLTLPLISVASCIPDANGADSAEWIWGTRDRKAGQEFEFATAFDLNGKEPASAKLRGLADFCDLKINLNDALIGSVETFSSMFELDASNAIRPGENNIRLSCVAGTGPSAIFVELEIIFVDGTTQRVVTNSSWTARSSVANKPAMSLGLVAAEPWGTRNRAAISEFDDYHQWKMALESEATAEPSSFQIVPGFEISLVRSASKDEGSWVSMEFDSKGRLIVAREDKGLLRMTLSDDGSTVEKVETINDSLKECRGLLFAFDSLYANANNSKGLYRLRDTTNDDKFDKVELLREFPGNVGHGRNDLALGPDGKIYSIHGDAVSTPTDMKDLTSPFRENRLGKKIPSGHLVRTDRDGKEWELVISGMRNPYGIDFNPDGQPFTYDADAEFDMGAPWYRATHVMHLIDGSDFGWRGVTEKWPPYFHDHPDNSPLTLEVGKGSPTAVKFGTNSNFPGKYRRALFILDWAYGRIVSVHMTPRGASYACRSETFLKGKPLNVTDLGFSTDGSMYFVTGGRKTQAGLYRVRYVGDALTESKQEPQEVARAAHAKKSRSILAKLNANAGLDSIWQYLGSDDPALRSAARIALEHHALNKWQERAFTEKQPRVLLNAMMAIARSNNEALKLRVLEKLNELDYSSLPDRWKLIALHTYLLCVESLNDDAQNQPDGDWKSKTVAKVDSITEGSSRGVMQEASRLLVAIPASGLVDRIMPLLLKADGQREQFLYLYLLRNVKDGWTIEHRSAWFQTLNLSHAYHGGRGLPGFLNRIRSEAIATLSDPERKLLGSVIEAPEADRQIEIPERPFVRKWTLEELVKATEKSQPAGDADRGRDMFTAAACVGCHRVGLEGNLIGPDLTSASSRFSRRDLLDSIVSPSKVIAPKYGSVIVETIDGRTLSGRIVPGSDYRDSKLRLATDPNSPHKNIEVNKADIVDQSPSSISWMPEGLLSTLSEQDVRDLLEYIETAGVVN